MPMPAYSAKKNQPRKPMRQIRYTRNVTWMFSSFSPCSGSTAANVEAKVCDSADEFGWLHTGSSPLAAGPVHPGFLPDPQAGERPDIATPCRPYRKLGSLPLPAPWHTS